MKLVDLNWTYQKIYHDLHAKFMRHGKQMCDSFVRISFIEGSKATRTQKKTLLEKFSKLIDSKFY